MLIDKELYKHRGYKPALCWINPIIQEKFGKSAKALLLQYAEESVTYHQAAKITGMTTGTIRKWCARYDIRLLAQSDGKKKKPVDDFRLLANKDIFQAKAINIENALSRRWSLQPNIYR